MTNVIKVDFSQSKKSVLHNIRTSNGLMATLVCKPGQVVKFGKVKIFNEKKVNEINAKRYELFDLLYKLKKERTFYRDCISHKLTIKQFHKISSEWNYNNNFEVMSKVSKSTYILSIANKLDKIQQEIMDISHRCDRLNEQLDKIV